MSGAVKVVKIDTDKYPSISSRHSMQARGPNFKAPNQCLLLAYLLPCLLLMIMRFVKTKQEKQNPLVTLPAGLPTLVLFNKVNELHRIEGFLPAMQLADRVRYYLAK